MEKQEIQKLNLYEKIQEVGNAITNIEKDMQVGKGNYAYKAVSDNMVTQLVKAAETKFRLVSIPIKQDLVLSEKLKTLKSDGSEAIKFVDDIKMTLRIINLDDISQFLDVESFGKGLDSGDKGFGKASTYARKYALLNAYKIATGEDLDAEKSIESKTITEDEKLNAIKNVMNDDPELTLNISKHFNVKSMEDLTKAEIKTIYSDFKNKGRL